MYSDSDFQNACFHFLRNIPTASSVILFGSYANGSANEKSDIDILILLDKDLEWKERHNVLNRIYNESGQNGYHIDFLLKTNNNFENDRVLPTLSRVVSREGRVLWTRN
ncbi:MAG: nucleotidyltransferase domain-containing protein [Bacteroidetes bacterium]|nr:nucleotidyltransferase domain-containing protein [Bacteroidota bacterium]